MYRDDSSDELSEVLDDLLLPASDIEDDAEEEEEEEEDDNDIDEEIEQVGWEWVESLRFLRIFFTFYWG